MSSSSMQPGQDPQTDLDGVGGPAGQDEQVGGAQERGAGDPQVGEATGTESESQVRESGAEQERRDLDVERDAEDEGQDEDPRVEDEEERRRREEEFAREHDPSKHDVAAGEEFRQRGDLIVDGDRAKAVDGEGRYVDAGDAAGLAEGSATPAVGEEA